MEILRPATTSHVSGGNWLMEETKSNVAVAASSDAATWTVAENKAFENALAVYDDNTPDRWQKVAAAIPGKTVSDVIKQYNDLEADLSSIEAGLIPVPGYITSPFTLDWAGGGSCDGFKPGHPVGGKRSPAGRSLEMERKKGVPWTEEEHKLFLMGLKKYGKGDWRNISRNFVITRTPTQVASHAQKYFIRQHSGGKDKRRASIHDITTVNLEDVASLETNKSSIVAAREQRSRLAAFPWSQTDSNGTHPDAFNITIGNAISGVHSYGQALLGPFNTAESCYDAQNTMYQL
ncbi:Homeodomain-like transcriptional regulator [Hirschfeldia incana]|nr:Homeodomain-like transcriptional regulator [Hirschfeldia incana]